MLNKKKSFKPDPEPSKDMPPGIPNQNKKSLMAMLS